MMRSVLKKHLIHTTPEGSNIYTRRAFIFAAPGTEISTGYKCLLPGAT
jgi:hypothetical protein